MTTVLEPVAEQIVARVVDRLKLIQVPLGYQLTVIGVTRPTRFGSDSPGNLRVYVAVESLTPTQALSSIGNPPAQGWEMVVRCAMIVTPPEQDQTAADTWRLRSYASMSRALTGHPDWYHWDGLAVNSRILAPEMRVNPAEGQVGAHLLVNIQFRTDEDNPYQVRG